jgi:GT2 family glycosyltransferase
MRCARCYLVAELPEAPSGARNGTDSHSVDDPTVRLWVIVLNWNDWSSTAACVESIGNSLDHSHARIDLTIAVVDNGSTDTAPAEFYEAFGSVVIIENPVNLGYGGGNNVGIRRALGSSADYVLILNNDTIVESGALSAMLRAAAATPSDSSYVVVPEIRYLEEPQTLWYRGGGYERYLAKPKQWGIGQPASAYVSPPERPTFATGCALLVPAQTFRNVGLFREDYFLYWEDVEFSLRLLEEGGTIVVCRDAVVLHRCGGGSSYHGVQKTLFYYFNARNRLWTILLRQKGVERYVALARTIETVARSLAYLFVFDREARFSKVRAITYGVWDGFRRGAPQCRRSFASERNRAGSSAR